MKHTSSYGSLYLPEDWEDRSTYRFLSPAKGPDFGSGARVSLPRISVFLWQIQIPVNVKFEEFLTQQTNELRKVYPSLRVMSFNAWQHPKQGAVPTIDVSFEINPGQQVRQLQFYFELFKQGSCICLTISSDADRYECEKKWITPIFETFEPASA